MAPAETRIPAISMTKLERILDACVIPASDDPSMLEIRREKIPPRFLPDILSLEDRTGESTSSGPLLIRRDDWEETFSYLWQISMWPVMEAEGFALADRGPSGLDLKDAPLADPWVCGRNSSGDLCLIAFRPCGRGGHRTKAFSSMLRGIDVDQRWALTSRGWFRLGQRVSGPEFQKLRPRYSNLQEFNDEEIKAALLAHRARVASQIRQLLPPAQPRPPRRALAPVK